MAEIYRQKNRLFLFQLNQTSFYQFFFTDKIDLLETAMRDSASSQYFIIQVFNFSIGDFHKNFIFSSVNYSFLSKNTHGPTIHENYAQNE